jgi:hypothetical protein
MRLREPIATEATSSFVMASLDTLERHLSSYLIPEP